MIRKMFYFKLALASALVLAVLHVWLDASRLPRRISNAPAEEPQDSYLIYTPTCQIPKYDPFHSSISKFLLKPEVVNCNPKRLKPLTYTVGSTIKMSSDENVLRSYGFSASDVTCYFREIIRNPKPWDHYKLRQWLAFNETTPAFVTTDEAQVICNASNYIEPFYKNVHYFIHKEKIQEKILTFSERQAAGEARPLNIIILGIDSTSHQNFVRYLPQTFKLLSQDPAVLDFLGYNKVGDNTLPNVSPVIMDARADDILTYKLDCYKQWTDNFDDCPFIWKNFTSKGYATVFAEDASGIGMFHFNKVGFNELPTDFYARNYFVIAEEEIGHSKIANLHSCLGLQLTTEVIYEHILQALDNLSDSIPVFGFFWTSSLTHKFNEKAASIDQPTFYFLQKFLKSRHRNNTIILFFGDHGLRFGEIRTTYLGALEERLPFVRMIFPLWFPEKFKKSWKNLLINQKRLTNNYDLHSTLLDILHGSFDVSSNPKSSFGYGRSLFLEIPSNRTCESAHIPHHFCVCQPSVPARVTDANVIRGARTLVKAINEKLSRSPQCASLQLDQIYTARIAHHHSDLGKKVLFRNKTNLVKSWKVYTLVLQTKPGGGRFEGSVVKDGVSWSFLGEVSRVNLYGNQSYCVQDLVLKKFCYCI